MTSVPGPTGTDGRPRGAGLFGSALGVVIFLVFLLFAMQLLWGMYATSVITAAAYDAGRTSARTGDADAGTARFARSIGSYDATVAIAVGDETVVVTVRGDNPALLPDRFARTLPFGTIDRRLEIRRERFVD